MMIPLQIPKNSPAALRCAAGMGRPGNTGGPQWPLLVLILICLMLLMAGFYGCGISKATQKVLTNDAAFNKVGTAWAKLNPCVVDSTKTLVHDTTVTTDTAYKLVPAITTAAQPALPSQPGGPDTLVQTITKTVTVHDSVKIVSVDERQLGICNDSITFYKMLYANYKAGAVQEADGWKHKAHTRLWYLIGLITAVCIYIFRKPLLAAIGGLPALLTQKI